MNTDCLVVVFPRNSMLGERIRILCAAFLVNSICNSNMNNTHHGGVYATSDGMAAGLGVGLLAGHMAMLVLTSLIFISASMGPALNGSLTVASVLFNIFMNALELLVAFIQAYVFTMLSAVFIGLAQEGKVETK